MKYSGDSPIYLQIYDNILHKIARGEYAPGEAISSVRELALQYQVNPNTMSKVLSMLDQEKLSYTERTSGRFITDDQNRIQKLKEQLIEQSVQKYLKEATSLGFTKQEAIKHLEEQNE